MAGGEVDALTALARHAMALLEFGRAHAEQAEKLTRLDQVARERSLHLRELQHRVRNNLQVIESLIDLQIGSERGCQAREALARIQTRLRPLLLIDRQLETDDPLADVDLATFLGELCHHLVDLHGADRCVDLVARLEPTVMTRERAVAIGLIVNEFVTNSFKHAFDADGGRLCVTLARDRGQLSLTLADDGRGLPHEQRAGGLGLRIIPALVEQLEGSLEWRNGTGTTLAVSL
jgi:two-component sensor histidine kinase